MRHVRTHLRAVTAIVCVYTLMPEAGSAVLAAQSRTAELRRIELPRGAIGTVALTRSPAAAAPLRFVPRVQQVRIRVVGGDEVVNDIAQRIAGEPIVEVVDENDNPVAGVTILFQLPDTGPSGLFGNGQTTLSTVTDNTGRAVGSGLTPNNVEGPFQIQVNATYQGQTITTSIAQTNALGAGVGGGAAAAGGAVATGGGISGTTLAIIGAIVGGVAAGVTVAVTGGPDIIDPPPAPTVSLGPPAVGLP